MFSTPILDVAIGLVFVYLLLSLICTTLTETISGWLNTRGKTLEDSLKKMLGPEAQGLLYKHPLITGVSTQPSYIDARKFATALLDVATGANPVTDLAAANAYLANLPAENPLRRALTPLLTAAGQDFVKAHQAVEDWFNHSMERLSGQFKRWAQNIAIILAVMVTLAMNADTIKIAHTLWINPTVRALVVEEAKQRAKAAGARPPVEHVDGQDPADPTKTISVPTVVTTAGITADEEAAFSDLTGWKSDLAMKESGGDFLLAVVKTHALGWL